MTDCNSEPVGKPGQIMVMDPTDPRGWRWVDPVELSEMAEADRGEPMMIFRVIIIMVALYAAVGCVAAWWWLC